MIKRKKITRIKNNRIVAYNSYQRQSLEKKVHFENILPKNFSPNLVEENGKYRYKHHSHIFQEAALSFADRVNYKTTYFFIAKTGFLFFDSFVLNVANLANTLRNAVRQRDYITADGEYLEGVEVYNASAYKRFMLNMKACLKMLFQMYRFTRSIKLSLDEHKTKDVAVVFNDMAMPATFELHCHNEYLLQAEKYFKTDRAEERANQRLFHCTMREVYFRRESYQRAMDSYLQLRREKRELALERFKKNNFQTFEQPISESDLELDDDYYFDTNENANERED
jgi:hypothetical protein